MFVLLLQVSADKIIGTLINCKNICSIITSVLGMLTGLQISSCIDIQSNKILNCQFDVIWLINIMQNHWRQGNIFVSHYSNVYGVSNHRHLDCLLNHLFRRRSKKTSKLCITGLWEGINRSSVDSPHKGPITRKMFPFDDVSMTKTKQCEILIAWHVYMLGHLRDSGHNGHKPKRPKPKRPQTETATNRNGHKPKRPQTGTATNRKGHRPDWPQTGTVTNRNGHKPERPQIEIDTTISDSAGYKCMCSIEVSNSCRDLVNSNKSVTIYMSVK